MTIVCVLLFFLSFYFSFYDGPIGVQWSKSVHSSRFVMLSSLGEPKVPRQEEARAATVEAFTALRPPAGMSQTTASADLPDCQTADVLANASSRLAMLIRTPDVLEDAVGGEDTECVELLRCLRNLCCQHPSAAADLAAGDLLEALVTLLASSEKQLRGAFSCYAAPIWNVCQRVVGGEACFSLTLVTGLQLAPTQLLWPFNS